MDLVTLIAQANSLLDAGTLSRADESFVTSAVMRYDRTRRLLEDDVVRLRRIVDANT